MFDFIHLTALAIVLALIALIAAVAFWHGMKAGGRSAIEETQENLDLLKIPLEHKSKLQRVLQHVHARFE